MTPTGVPRPETSRDARAGVRNVGLVLRPERDLDEALRQIGDWAAAMGVALVGAEGDPRLPDEVARTHPGGFAERARCKLGITDPAGLRIST
jgi:hypothetical protein